MRDRDDRIVARSDALRGRLLPGGATRAAALRDAVPGYADDELSGEPIRLYAAPLAETGGPVAGGTVVVASSMGDIEDIFARLREAIALAALAAALLGGLLATGLVAGALRPLRRLAAGARAIGAAPDPGRRLPEPATRDEVGALAGALNRMLAALDRAREAERRLLADASHELRTPVTSLRGNAAFARTHGADDELLAELEADAERLTRLVDDLLALEREAGADAPGEEVDLEAVVASVAGDPPDPGAGGRVVVTATAPLAVRGQAGALERALRNLVENACVHGPDGGEVRVALARRGDEAVLSVSDDGPGFTAAQAEAAPRRFWRGPDAAAVRPPGIGARPRHRHRHRAAPRRAARDRPRDRRARAAACQGTLKAHPYLGPMTRSLPRYLIHITAVVLVLAGAAIAIASRSEAESPPPDKPLAQAVQDALSAPAPEGVSGRLEFSNRLIDADALPDASLAPLIAGAEGRFWIGGEGRARVELETVAGNVQVELSRDRLSLYDPLSQKLYVAPAAELPRPDGAADLTSMLTRIARSFDISGAQPGTVAGKAAYTVRLAPRHDGGLLGAAEVAWDAAHGIPLRAAIYAQGEPEPVLELKATDVDFGAVSDADLRIERPAGTRVVEIDHAAADHHGGGIGRSAAVASVQAKLDFDLSAPRELAGLPRRSVRTIRLGDEAGALATYGKGIGALMVIEHPAGDEAGPGGDLPGLQQLSIGGATARELTTALGTLIQFERGGVSYTVLGSVPPAAAEAAARAL